MRLIRAKQHVGSTFEQPARTCLLPARGRVAFDCVLYASVSQPSVRELSEFYRKESLFGLGFS